MRALLLAFFLVAAGCSGSVLVRPDDGTFARAQARLARTHELVAQEAPPAPEAAMFLHAEALYRYRFDPPPRTFGNYVAQTLAVATEFAPLQAIAASAGMFELRLRVYDGAVQLWETLLVRHPQTRLRPLALYRLGWAYRSVGIMGLPREEGDHAWDELVARHPGSPLAKLALEAKQVPWKSQESALSLSIIPGLGQVYAGEIWNGVGRFGLALACAALIVVPVLIAYDRATDDELVWSRDWPLLATPLVGIVLLNVVYTSAYQDALRAAVEFNERAEKSFDDRHPDAP